MNVIERIHGRAIHGRRVRTLAGRLAELLEPGASVLDVGTGDGLLAGLLAERVPRLKLEGVEVQPRSDCAIPVRQFDGRILPYDAHSFDVVMFVDVLHHAAEPMLLLTEARRVSRSVILIKDHLLEGLLAGPTLRFMDRVGNARHGVPVPGNYWPRSRWSDAFEQLGLKVSKWETRLGLYPWFLNWWFGRQLHFVANLAVPPQEPHET